MHDLLMFAAGAATILALEAVAVFLLIWIGKNFADSIVGTL